ncbi:DUF4269 domain-containing protein [Mucilaginibacter aquatilis]|uniref:DUF4269 domain-containing protein n=1 Tax=Mucilaginibacter aquatilis TaxID=1517760 RepID=A0A6I4I935_9SPHI|nr:DUF4269 domain-containing protein [Mucilaginibacter aquatilis]MVN89966.1 DUF4269 domain-containing protein [Mucilaginibacter aquatilis]
MPYINFDNIDYLANGTSRQQSAYRALTSLNILSLLQLFEAVLAGTVPLNIDIQGSDLDILCHYTDKGSFINTLVKEFSFLDRFKIYETSIGGTDAVVANFFADDWEVEVFGQSIPVKQQFGYRHMIIEHQLLEHKGESFRQQIIQLKQQGYKTEPAFAKALNLEGNPYIALLDVYPSKN